MFSRKYDAAKEFHASSKKTLMIYDDTFLWTKGELPSCEEFTGKKSDDLTFCEVSLGENEMKVHLVKDIHCSYQYLVLFREKQMNIFKIPFKCKPKSAAEYLGRYFLGMPYYVRDFRGFRGICTAKMEYDLYPVSEMRFRTMDRSAKRLILDETPCWRAIYYPNPEETLLTKWSPKKEEPPLRDDVPVRWECVICLENTRLNVAYPCKHILYCDKCVVKPELDKKTCLICKTPVKEIDRLFLS